MITGASLLIIIALAILFIVIASSFGKLHPFLALILAALGVGFAAGMPAEDLLGTLTAGFGNITASIGLIIVFGTVIGVALEESGAAAKIAHHLVQAFGPKRIVLAMGCIGGFVGIPVFCDSGFIILSRLAGKLAQQTGKSPVSLCIAMAGGLYTTHVLVPPTPGPLAAAATYGAEQYLGAVIVTGLLLSIPGVLVSYWWAVRAGQASGTRQTPPETERISSGAIQPGQPHDSWNEKSGAFPQQETESEAPLPSLFLSLLPLVLPVLLIAGGSIAAMLDAPAWIFFVCKPVIALLAGVFCSFLLLIKPGASRQKQDLGSIATESKPGRRSPEQWIGKALVQAGPIILITAAGGAFGAVLKATPLDALFESWISAQNISGVWFLPMVFLLAAGLKTSQGSSTAAIIVSATLIAPFLPALGIDSAMELGILVSVTGAGSMVVSHTNDSYFWVVSQFGGMNMTQTLRTFTVATLLQGITILICAMAFLLIVGG